MMRVRVKICGVTSVEAVQAAVEHGADALGFVFAESPRRVTIELAQQLARDVPPFITRVAVFRHADPDHVLRIIGEFGPHTVQTEADPAVEAVLPDGVNWLPVFHDHDGLVSDAREYFARQDNRAHAVLLEAPGRGGRGIAPDWGRAAELARQVPLVLAGGLRPDNVGQAVQSVRPFAVDVSSGVESSPGRKDPRHIADFLGAVRRAEREARPRTEVTT